MSEKLSSLEVKKKKKLWIIKNIEEAVQKPIRFWNVYFILLKQVYTKLDVYTTVFAENAMQSN